MKAYLFSGTLAIFCAGSLALAQQPAETSNQTPPPATTQSETTQQDTRTPSDVAGTQQAGTTTLTGCLYRERDVPGREPNIVERGGVLEDYILATGPSGAAQPGAAPEATGTSGAADDVSAAGRMYKVEHIDDNRLQELVGKRVEVTGRVDAEAGDTGPVGTAGAAGAPQPAQPAQPDRAQEPQRDQTFVSPDSIELPEFEAVSIREVSGTCAPQPAAR